ncbi:MAG TPA: glycosyltransferase family 1 protein [Leptolyngbyaceae cyanobacterium M33_DOE_097]|uniref:Glycosyltransferase family 1 protein n=1 Tax=Oscillatoriales cyanobacterium SpSt-418 TaxID=2282169 RepID=A0A7C3PR18_9CYAN|nr:glycosyltransferase family 1 protein [Leptolyngbyaceae cyanobacterium M33_DOE_097]
MFLNILSQRNLVSTVSTDCLFEFEDLVVQTCGAQILAPIARPVKIRAHHKPTLINRLSEKVTRRLIGAFEPLSFSLPSQHSPKVLLIPAIHGHQLHALSAIKDWRKQFDIVAAYVFDAWNFDIYPDYVRQFDHLFVPMPELVEPLHQTFQIPVSFLPFGSDALQHGSNEDGRFIDLLSYGRIPEAFHRAFSEAFNQPGSEQLYYRATPRASSSYPNRPYRDREDIRDRRLFYQLLRRTKLAIAFDTMYPGMREFPYPFITIRWFECSATGCGIVGKRPTTPAADELLNWRDATIELPDNPQRSVEMIRSLLDDPHRLQAIRSRNYKHNLARHDWRWRIEQMLQTLGLPIPHPLERTLHLLRLKAAIVAESNQMMISS